MVCVMLVTLLPYVTLLPVWSIDYTVHHHIHDWNLDAADAQTKPQILNTNVLGGNHTELECGK